MISLEYLWIGIGFLAIIMILFELRRFRKRRIWMSLGKNPRSCYMEVSKKWGGRVFPIGGGGENILGQVKFNEDNDEIADIYIVDPEDLSQGKNKLIYAGYVTSEGRVFKGHILNQKKQKPYGYTANPDNLEQPSVELKWRKKAKLFNWYGELDVVKGVPPCDEEKKGEVQGIKSEGMTFASHEQENDRSESSENDAESEKQEKKKKAKVVAKGEVFRYPPAPKDEKIPDIVRAAAFMLLYKDYVKRDQEDLVEQPYGWRDTAFLSMILYTLIYLVFYSVYCAVLEMPFIGQSYQMGMTVAAFYIAIWGVVRQFKINSIENGSSIQSQLDMLNSRVGIAWITFVIAAFSVLSIVVSVVNGEQNYELLPLQIVVIVGLAINYTQKGVGISKRWNISETLNIQKTSELDADSEDENERKRRPPSEPTGNIPKTFEWEFPSEKVPQKDYNGSISVLFDPDDIRYQRQVNPFYMQRVDLSMGDYAKKMFDFIVDPDNDAMMNRVRWIAQRMIEQGNRLNRGEFIQFVVNFVLDSNIEFRKAEDCKSIDFPVKYIRFPDETLFDQEGDDDSKVFLAAMLFYALGYNVLFMHSTIKKHSILGVEPKKRNWCKEYFESRRPEDVFMKKNGHQYIMCECTGTGEKADIGTLPDGFTAADFDTQIPLFYDVQSGNLEEETVSYSWTFDGVNCAIDFTFLKKDIQNLREQNVFSDEDGEQIQGEPNHIAVYKQRIPEALRNLLTEDDEIKNKNVIKLCDTLNKIVKDNHFEKMDSYPLELKLVLLAGSFIRSAVKDAPDEDNDIILKIRERTGLKIYVRNPDELLYDQEGDADCKSFSMIMILRYLGINSLFIASNVYERASYAVEYKEDWDEALKEYFGDIELEHVTREYEGKKFIYCDTASGENGKLSKMDLDNFEIIVELLAKQRK